MNNSTESSQSLPRLLGPWMASAIVVGTVIGSGVFKKAQNVSERVPEFGPAMIVWVLGGLLALLGALALAEIAVLLPRAGGNYAFLKDAYGRLFGFLWGWVEFWIIRSASIAALATMFAEGLNDVLRQSLQQSEVLSFWQRQGLAGVTIAVLAFVNALGTRIGGGLQVVITSVKIGSILGIIALPWLILACVDQPAHPPRLANLGRIWPEDWSAFNIGKFGAALVGVLWAYHGWMNIGPVAEEVRQPQRNIPLSLLGGVTLLIVIYLGANLSYYLVIPREEMKEIRTTAVSTEFALRLLGPVGAILGSGALMMSVFGSLNGNLLVGPRLLFAMARDRLAPEALASIHPRTQTPAIATAVLATWSILIIAAGGALTQNRIPILEIAGFSLDVNVPQNKPLFDVVTDFAMFGAVCFETLVIAGLFVFRRRYPASTHPLPYRCPGFPVVPALYVAIMLAVLVNMFASPDQRTESIVGLVFIGVGALVYAGLFARRK
jgi:basic amino acid/polyamine antiporter, APA family